MPDKLNLAIELIGLTKKFGEYTAVDCLELQVKKGSVFGFLGPNGAGKTTTMKMMMGLSKPTAGSINILGREVGDGLGKISHSIGYLPEVPSFYGWMRAGEYLAFSGELFGIEQSILKPRISDLLNKAGLQKIKKPISAFSRGMKQRLGIAQALINDPQVIFLDEPTSALDPIGRKEILEHIDSLSEERTVFLSTHILSDVERVCDEVAIIDKGKLIVQTDLKALKEKYERPLFELSFEEPAASFREYLNVGWVEDIEVNGGSVKVKVTDLAIAQSELPKLIVRSKMKLRSFRIVDDTFEDIFIQLLGSND